MKSQEGSKLYGYLFESAKNIWNVCVKLTPPPRNGYGEEPLANTIFLYLSVCFFIQEIMKFGFDLYILNLIHNYISNIT